MGVGPFAFRYQGNGATHANILIPLERQLIAQQLCCWQFLYNETLQCNLFVLYCRNCPKDDKFRYLIPIVRKLGAAYNLGWWLAGKPAHDFLFAITERFFASSYHWCNTRQNVSKLIASWRGVGQFEPRFQGKGVVPWEYFLVSRKLDTFCYLTVQTAPCYVQSFWYNTGVWQTDGIAIASTALAMRALRSTVKKVMFFNPVISQGWIKCFGSFPGLMSERASSRKKFFHQSPQSLLRISGQLPNSGFTWKKTSD